MTQDAKSRLLAAGTKLIAEQGLAGASVRDICAQAGVGRNMIHHYFGSKDGLFQAILDAFSSDGFAPAIRTIATPAQSAEEFRIKMQLLLTETLEVLVANSRVFRIMTREQSAFLPLKPYRGALLNFLNQAKQSGFIRETIAVDMIAGVLLDRLGNQVLYALMLGDNKTQNVILDPVYRQDWIKTNADILIFGFAKQTG
ncbi:hypothetical protein NBRC116601_02560 [Cognatishimia sp. WU-CL00825]